MVYPKKSNVSSGNRHRRVFFSFTVSFSLDIMLRISAIACSAVPRQQITSRVARGNCTPGPSRNRTWNSRPIRLLWSSRRSYPDLPQDEQMGIAARHPTQPVGCVGDVTAKPFVLPTCPADQGTLQVSAHWG